MVPTNQTSAGSPIIILGAGITGLIAGRELARRHLPLVVYEKEGEIGGLCVTKRQDGFTFDAVSHVLHFRSGDNEQLVQELLHGQLLRQQRSSWVYYRGRYIPYPFQTHIGFLGPRDRVTCAAGLLAAAMSRSVATPASFEQWTQRAFGAGISSRFMKPYNEKLWGVPLSELSTDWIQPFIPRVSPTSVAKSFLRRRSAQGYNSTFAYPSQGGIQQLAERLGDGLDVRRRQEVMEIDLASRTIQFRDGDGVQFERLVSTIPLSVLVERCTGVPEALRECAKRLRATSLLSATFGLNCRLSHEFHWVYFPDREFPFFRLFFPSNVAPRLAPEGCALVTAEMSNVESENAQDEVVGHLQRLGYIRRREDVLFASGTYLPHAYPVHTLGRAEIVKQLREYFVSRNVWPVGRFGEWKYSSIDDCMTSGRKVVEEMVG